MRLVATTAFQVATGTSSSGTAGAAIPALLNSTSSLPNTSRVLANSACTDAGVGHIAAHRKALPPGFTGRGQHLGQRRFAAARQHHPETRGQKGQRHGAADAAAGSGDQRDLQH